MFSPMLNPATLLALHKARERELLAKARESHLLSAAKNARTLKAAGANKPRLRDRFLVGIGRSLMSFGLRFKQRLAALVQQPVSSDPFQAPEL